MKHLPQTLTLCAGVAFLTTAVLAQAPAPATPAPQTPAPAAGGRGRGGPTVVSPQIGADGRVTFRVLAPQATTVTVGGDINGSLTPTAGATPEPAPPGGGRGGPPAVVMAKGEDGVWSGTTIRAVKPGAWRYTFTVDGVTTVDSRNTRVSPSQTQVQSLLVVPGDFSETRDVPHGAVSIVALHGVRPPERAARDVRLHAARIRQRERQLPRAVSDPRRRRHRIVLVDGGTRQRHSR